MLLSLMKQNVFKVGGLTFQIVTFAHRVHRVNLNWVRGVTLKVVWVRAVALKAQLFHTDAIVVRNVKNMEVFETRKVFRFFPR